MAADAKDRVRASTYRKRGAKRSPAQQAWLDKYDAEREVERKLRGELPRPELPAAESLDVAPPPDAFQRADIPDLRNLDTPTPPEGDKTPTGASEGSGPQVSSPEPMAQGASFPSAPQAAVTAPGAGCGKCSTCRGANRAVCPVSGSTVPQPLSEREAMALSITALTMVAVAVGGMYKGTPDPASADQKADLSGGLQALSEKYDLHTLGEIAPFLMVARALGGYAVDAKRSALAHPKVRHGAPAPMPAKV